MAYLKQLKKNFQDFGQGKKIKIFIFGSSLEKEHFGDIDVGILGKIDKTELRKLKENFDESTFPYVVDIVNFETVSPTFKNNVLKNKILWIKR